MMAMRSFCRLAVSTTFRARAQHVRSFHIDTTHHHETPEVLSDMISSGTHASTEKITRFMNAIYVKQPRSVSLFSFNYRQHTERSTIRGITIGNNGRRATPQKNAVLVSGLPFQDPSLVGVGLYVAAMLSRTSSMLPRDVSVIPLAHPKEYERRWLARSAAAPFGNMFAVPPNGAVSEDMNWLEHETVDLKETCKPIEAYITRKSKVLVNVAVTLTPFGATMQYKDSSFPLLSSKSNKFPLSSSLFPSSRSSSSFPFSSSSSSPPVPLPPSINRPLSSDSLGIYEPNPIFGNMLESPAFVLELKGTQALDDEQVVARGNEIIQMMKELFE